MAWAVFNSFRDYAYTAENGYVSFGGFTLDNYNAWERGAFGQSFVNSLLITVPAVIPVLLFASCTAFVPARFSYRFNLALLGVVLAANLLPPQALLVPILRAYLWIPLPEFMSSTGQMWGSYLGLTIINVAFRLGFCTFVLSNYMKTLPHEISESAMLDGASVFRQFWQLTPVKFPVTSSLNSMRGQLFVDYDLLSAGSVTAALPVLVVFFALQRQFVAGLTHGSTKG